VRAIDELPESMRAALVLRWQEGLSFEAIAAVLGRNEVAVRKRYSRALEELRRSLTRTLGLGGGRS
jgi:RNA polymerase sigma factor (sigma-70 family)